MKAPDDRPAFVYGTLLPGGSDAGWLAGLPGTAATVRGSLWRGPRRHPVIVPDPNGERIPGMLVPLDPAHRAVLDVLDSDPVTRRDATGVPWGMQRFAPRWLPVTALAGLRAIPAEVLGFPTVYAARLAGYRPARAPAAGTSR